MDGPLYEDVFGYGINKIGRNLRTMATTGLDEGVPADVNWEQPEIRIMEVMNGFKVHVGCKVLVFETKERMVKELARYLTDRKAVAKEYLQKYK